MKPITEPSQGRENSYLGWSSNQLFRRPPASSGGCNEGSWHYVGDPGEPAYEGDWQDNLSFTRFRTVCDETEIEISATGTSGTVIFTLPTGYAPSISIYAIVGDGSSTGSHNVVVYSDGTVNSL